MLLVVSPGIVLLFHFPFCQNNFLQLNQYHISHIFFGFFLHLLHQLASEITAESIGWLASSLASVKQFVKLNFLQSLSTKYYLHACSFFLKKQANHVACQLKRGVGALWIQLMQSHQCEDHNIVKSWSLMKQILGSHFHLSWAPIMIKCQQCFYCLSARNKLNKVNQQLVAHYVGVSNKMNYE